MTGVSNIPPDLSGEAWLQAHGAQAVFLALEAAGAEARAVGGAVRNSLLRQQVADVDIATTARPDKVVNAVEKAGLRAIPTGIDHGTISVLSNGELYEVTTLRQDVETFGRQARVVFGTDWLEDARRRDFTMNAIYVDRKGVIFDPLGGVTDCLEGRVRFIGDPEKRIREDYLRILRFFRIHATYGSGELDHEGLKASVSLKDGLDSLSAERVSSELKRTFLASGAVGVLPVMGEAGILGALLGDDIESSAYCALSELCREVGEKISYGLSLAVLVEPQSARLGALADKLKLSKADRDQMLAAASACQDLCGCADGIKVPHLLYRHGRKALIDGLLLFAARQRGDVLSGEMLKSLLSDITASQVPQFPLLGRDLLAAGVAAGPGLGAELARLERLWSESNFKLSKSELLLHL
ncbi:CCA tRNA nucleotidyltransferase [Roseibium sediminis]|uniref:CCA tRNA nucleotidyltransferase n=1 Tax=Roseibium sediminis TaxID=1775174 RepID=UPI00123D5E6A|nr:CCA tRNA nucleotidyltransferase [Roseibium sediminis]